MEFSLMGIQAKEIVVGNKQGFCKTGELDLADCHVTCVIIKSKDIDQRIDLKKPVEKLSLSDSNTKLIPFTFVLLDQTIKINVLKHREIFVNTDAIMQHINFDTKSKGGKESTLRLFDFKF
jgi:hypothetical protein